MPQKISKKPQGTRKRWIPPTNRTCLIFGEGCGDEGFLKYLRNLYGPNRTSGYSITIDCGCGGSTCEIIKSAFAKCRGRQYDYLVIVLDLDTFANKNFKHEKRAALKKLKLPQTERSSIPKKVSPHFSYPCLEAVLLKIHDNCPKHKTCQPYKALFKSKFGCFLEELTDKDWVLNFPKSLLDSKLPSIPRLRALVRLMSGRW